jgi:hypothetical protein
VLLELLTEPAGGGVDVRRVRVQRPSLLTPAGRVGVTARRVREAGLDDARLDRRLLEDAAGVRVLDVPGFAVDGPEDLAAVV